MSFLAFLSLVLEEKEVLYCFVTSWKDLRGAGGTRRPTSVVLIQSSKHYKELYEDSHWCSYLTRLIHVQCTLMWILRCLQLKFCNNISKLFFIPIYSSFSTSKWSMHSYRFELNRYRWNVITFFCFDAPFDSSTNSTMYSQNLEVFPQCTPVWLKASSLGFLQQKKLYSREGVGGTSGTCPPWRDFAT